MARRPLAEAPPLGIDGTQLRRFRCACSLLVPLASRSELLVPGRPASVLLHFPLLMATLDPISTRVFAFLLRVPRIVSPRLSRSPRIVPILSAILPALHALRL